MENKQQKEKGITLVALVVTIIVLVILVGVSVSTALNTGLIGNSKNAVAQYGVAQKNEMEHLDVIAGYVKDNTFAKAVSADPQTYYGQEVKGYIDLDANSSTNDWQIFSVEGNNVWITTKDYVRISKETAKKTGMYVFNSGYVVNWETVPTKYGYAKPNKNCIASLLDNENWTEYVDSRYALKAIGGPTKEMLEDANKAKTGAKFPLDTAYYIVSKNRAYSYWLCYEGLGSNVVYSVYCNGNLHGYNFDQSNSTALRPLVCLKSDVNFEQDENDSTVWNLLP